MEILFSENSDLEKSSEKIFNDFLEKENLLAQIDIDDLVELFNSISLYWTSSDCKIRDLLLVEGMGFIVPWLKKGNIKKLLNQNFSNYKLLDNPTLDKKDGKIYYGRPCGVAVHWIAGNVPVLGVISLFQTLLTKNKSIVKVPNSYKDVLPRIFDDLKSSKFFNEEETSILSHLIRSTLIIYTDKEDREWQNKLSQKADIRVAWGGAEAVNTIIGLNKKLNSRDLVYGPKISLAVASKKMIEAEDGLSKLAKLLADDVFPFDQAGCNAPHNLIIEMNTKYSTKQVSEKVHAEFEKRVNKISAKKDPIDSFNIILKKFIYQSEEGKSVLSSAFNNSNVFSSEEGIHIEDPLYSRSVFISSVKNIKEVVNFLPHNIQSVGLYVEEERKKIVIKDLADYGVDRFPDLGKMSLYQNPWDGYLPLQHMVRWISTN